MRLGRLSFGLNNYFIFDYTYSLCQCHILELGLFYVEWLSKDCASAEKDEEDE